MSTVSPKVEHWTAKEPALVARATINREGRIVSWNDALSAFSGWPREHAVGKPIAEVLIALEPREWPMPADASARETSSVLVAIRGHGEGAPRAAVALIEANGENERFVSLRPLPNVVGTAPKAFRPPADFDTQRLELVLSQTASFCYTVDTNLVFTSSEGAGLSALNLKPGQVVGTKLSELWGTSDPCYEPLACHFRALAGKQQTYQDVCLGRSLEYQLKPLQDERGRIVGVIGWGTDVTDRERAKDEHAKLTAQLRQAQKMEVVGQLAGGIAHDFNNLLTCIIGNLALAENRLEPNSQILPLVMEAAAAATNAGTLTKQLLAFSRKQVISPRPIDLSALIDRTQAMLQRLIGEGVELRAACERPLRSVHADPNQIEQVLVNLVGNARDAIDTTGRIEISTRNVEITEQSQATPALAKGRYVVLGVRDDGRGMSDAVRSKLFEPFFTTKPIGQGSGLGLATVYGAVQQNHGTITVESELGKGAKFEIYLPAHDGDPTPPESADTPRSRSTEVKGGNETVLLVEDETVLLDLAACYMQELGYQVIACASSDEALRQFAERGDTIDVLVTDVVMPRMNGKELASRLQALKPGLPVLYTSGYGENIIARGGVIEQGVHFISKPYRPEELAVKLRRVLD